MKLVVTRASQKGIKKAIVLTSHPSVSVPAFRVEVRRKYHPDGWEAVGLYFLRGNLTPADVQQIAQKLLADPVTEMVTVSTLDETTSELSSARTSAQHIHTIEVTLLPGVTDPAAENLLRTAHLLGISTLEAVATGHAYHSTNYYAPDALQRLATERFANFVIQRFTIDQPITPPFVPYQQTDDTVEIIALQMADDDRLLAISAERRLALNLPEMQAIRAYFADEGREPTDAELEMIAQTWSEHCIHKTFRALIDYTGPDGAVTINGLLRTYLRAATEQIAKPWVRSAFVDNAGIIKLDDEWDIAFKVETHNHPSALEPFGGANTGVGGVVRDILGVSARPIANTDILCFGFPDTPDAQIPQGVLHPRRTAEGVVRGIEDYGNKMGIPTVNGAILYHAGYTANPLVYCGCVGILPHGSHPTAAQPGDLLVVMGGRTGRDGLRGATFSSMEMDQLTSQSAGSSVQIGHPIHEKQVQEVVLRARDARLYHAITDCGAGGLSSAIGEMGQELGASVRLETVPLKYPGLRPWEIWLSEAQERMVLAVPPENLSALQAICAQQEVEAVVIGQLEKTGHLHLSYGDRFVSDLKMDFLYNGIPQRHLQARWMPKPVQAIRFPEPAELSTSLLQLLAHPDIRSKESVIRRYDHEVQGGTVVKPLVGVDNHGPSDAAVIIPLDTQPHKTRGIALSNGICPAYGEHDPYAMAWAAIDEAMRNAVAVGADPDQIAILDNFCWGSCSLPDRLGALVRCTQGCYDAAIAYQVPFISGKDSLNNEYADVDGQRHAIPGTLLISAVGIVPDATQSITMDLKEPGNQLYLIGKTHAELGSSHYAGLRGDSGGNVPQPVPNALDCLRATHNALRFVRACHDCSEGGIGVALAEMCLAGRLGAAIQLDSITLASINGESLRADEILFSESLCRFIVEVAPEHEDAFRAALGDVSFTRIGSVDAGDKLTIQYATYAVVQVAISELEKAWRGQDLLHIPPVNPPVSHVQPDAMIKPDKTTHAAKRVLILCASGSNRDRDAALACELIGAEPEIVHISQLFAGERRLQDYHMLILPGGFSYGDDLGAGKLWALDIEHRLGHALTRFVESGRPVIGICNGFQALVKSGFLPGKLASSEALTDQSVDRGVTLTFNESGHFECRWVYLYPNPNSACLFTQGLSEPIYCPVAHGEGRLVIRDQATRDALISQNLIALTYSENSYPANPNGSELAIAGLCNPAGNVLGLMPHPEDHSFPWQHPRWRRGEQGMLGLRLFQNALRNL